MSTQIPHEEPENVSVEHEQMLNPQQSINNQNTVQNNQGTIFYEDDDQEDLDQSFAVPFQMSTPLSRVAGHTQTTVHAANASPPPATTSGKGKQSFPLGKVVILTIAVVLLLSIAGIAAVAVFAAPTSPSIGQGIQVPRTGAPVPASTQSKPVSKGRPAVQPTSRPGSNPKSAPPMVQGASSNWVPQQLPAGWTNAGLTPGDALPGEEVAVNFVSHEMSFDFRSVGTREQHGGTLTSATFILSPAAKRRFMQNDRRVINNVLFDTIQKTQLIQVVVDVQPHLVNKFVTQPFQGQSWSFAWVDVSFRLWQSKTDPATNQRLEGEEMDAGTNQPKVQHMMVQLVRVPFTAQGANPPLGGTGWLVNDYALSTAPSDVLSPV